MGVIGVVIESVIGDDAAVLLEVNSVDLRVESMAVSSHSASTNDTPVPPSLLTS